MKRGLLVVFEGSEKSGKKTQSKLLSDVMTQISGKETLYVHFPDKSTSIGQLIERYAEGDLKLNPRSAHLLYTANRWERQKEISKALSSGINVVVDRYSYSGIVHTAALINPLSNADWSWCRSTEIGLIPPDVVFCLAGENLSEIAARVGFGEKSSETLDYQEKIIAYYARLSREMEEELKDDAGGNEDVSAGTNGGDATGQKIKPKLWNWIQATDQTLDDVHSCIMNIIDPLL